MALKRSHGRPLQTSLRLSHTVSRDKRPAHFQWEQGMALLLGELQWQSSEDGCVLRNDSIEQIPASGVSVLTPMTTVMQQPALIG